MIEIRRLHYDHPGAIPALRGIDLDLPAGEWAALIGANGSGKTTLARCLNGLLLPSAGSVWVDGLATADPAHLGEVRRRVAMVFQAPDDQLVAPTVETDIAFGLENIGVPPDAMRRRVGELLRVFRLERYRTHPPHLLSGGEKQRLAIASAVAVRPEHLILDEPTALLDPQARRDLVDLLGQLRDDLGLAILHITQSPEEAARAQRVLVLDGGRIVDDGPPRRIFGGGPGLARLGLSVPFSVSVAAAAGGGSAQALNEEELAGWMARAFEPDAGAGGLSPATAADGGARLETRRLHHVYRAGLPTPLTALEDVDLRVPTGRILGLVGPSGSGKTTLAQHLDGLLRPTSGQVLLDGVDIWNDGTARAARRHVGLVFQFPEVQLFEETVAADVAFGPMNHGCDPAEARRRAADALAAVGLPVAAFGSRSPLSLSGGERRRAAIAGVLAIEPAVVVLDEPTAGLDARSEEIVAQLLQNLAHRGTAIVLICHDMDRVSELASEVVVLASGRVCWQGPTRQVLADAWRQAAADGTAPVLEPTAAMRLSSALRRRGWPAPDLFTRADACAYAQRLRPRPDSRAAANDADAGGSR